jgi:hypothetical protein
MDSPEIGNLIRFIMLELSIGSIRLHLVEEDEIRDALGQQEAQCLAALELLQVSINQGWLAYNVSAISLPVICRTYDSVMMFL